MELCDIIIKRIQQSGPVSFHDFMDMALYYPGKGYYTSEKNRIGKQGDYYTSPTLSSLFGKMIGRQIEEMYRVMDHEPICIVEYGAGTGALCFDILSYLKDNEALYKHLKYCIIEKNDVIENNGANVFNEKIEFINNIEQVAGFTGCVLSNEVIDNFPIHLVTMQDELMEIFVDYKDKFTEVLLPANEELKNYLQVQNLALPKGYRTEINLEANNWIEKVAMSLKKGFVITIDYGFTCTELYSENRNTGTLACYYNHTVTDTPYSNIGAQDITAHVNFSALNFWGKKYGLHFTCFSNQNYFLRSMGLANYLRTIEIETPEEKREHLFFQLNKLLFEMGNNFKILIQQKGIKINTLSPMQFSQQLV